MFENMNIDLRVGKSAKRPKYTHRREAFSDISNNEDRVRNYVSDGEIDFCSDDSVKDPNYKEETKNCRSSSTSSEDVQNMPDFVQNHKKLFTKKKTLRTPSPRNIVNYTTADFVEKTKPAEDKNQTSVSIQEDHRKLSSSLSDLETTQNVVGSNQEKSWTAEDNNQQTFNVEDFNRNFQSDMVGLQAELQPNGSVSSSDSSSSSSSSSSDSSDSSSDSEADDDQRTSLSNDLNENSSIPAASSATHDCLEHGVSHSYSETSNNEISQEPSSSTFLRRDLEQRGPDNNTPISLKRKLNKKNWLRNRAKLLQNTGKSYKPNSKIPNKVVPERNLKPPCSEKCKQKCTKKITELQRKDIFDAYWALGDSQRQREFILRHMTQVQPRYSYKMHNSKRGNNNGFYLTVNQERIRVCKNFVMHTLDISDRPIRTIMEKIRSENCAVLTLDNRGKHSNHKALDPKIKDGVRRHIDSIPRVESHYCRADSKREYIDGDKSITDLHRDYVNDCKSNGIPFANYQMYYNIFYNEYNISHFKPKKDQCEDCTIFANATESQKNELKDKYERHLKEKELARKNKGDDKMYTPDNCIVSVYDLQAAMPCPKGDVSNFYYLSKLNVYNFSVCNIKNMDVSCYVWHEGEGKRGSTEIGTCILKYIESLRTVSQELDSKLDLVFYSDNCCGQQKNQYIISLYIYAVNHYDFVNSITHKYLIKGHTQNEGDNVHSVIERQIKKALNAGPIFTPDQYIHIIRNAKKSGSRYKVTELTHNYFIDMKSLAATVGKNFTKNTEKETLKMGEIKQLCVNSDDLYCFHYKTSYEDDVFKKIQVYKTTGRSKKSTSNAIILKQAYRQKLPICEKKKKGLLGLIKKNIIPQFYKTFYESI